MSQVISSFRGPYFFLSSFFLVYVQLDGIVYSSVEHGYQASKNFNIIYRQSIQSCSSPGVAKALGRKVDLRSDWTTHVKISIMRNLLEQKFDPILNPDLYSLLKSTGNAEIVEGNTWGDTFWGICKGEGKNWLGRLIMEIRDK